MSLVLRVRPVLPMPFPRGVNFGAGGVGFIQWLWRSKVLDWNREQRLVIQGSTFNINIQCRYGSGHHQSVCCLLFGTLLLFMNLSPSLGMTLHPLYLFTS